jgi:hypothetical protein
MAGIELKVSLYSSRLLGAVKNQQTIPRRIRLLEQLGLVLCDGRGLNLAGTNDVVALFCVVVFTTADLIACRDFRIDELLAYRNPCNLRKALNSAIDCCTDAGLSDIITELEAVASKNFSGGYRAPHESLKQAESSHLFEHTRSRLRGLTLHEGAHGFSLVSSEAFKRGDSVITLRPEDSISLLSAFRDSSFPASDMFEQGLHPDVIFLLYLIYLRDLKESLDNSIHREFFASQPSCYGTLFELPIAMVQSLEEPDLVDSVTAQNSELEEICKCLHPSPDFKDLLWAKSLCTSRAFSLPIQPISKVERRVISEHYPSGNITTLLPGVHFLNHDFSAQLMTPEISESGDIHVKTFVDIESDSELFLLYGGFSNREFMLNYGFFIPNNPYDSFTRDNGNVVRRGACAVITDEALIGDLISAYSADKHSFQSQN